MGPSFCMHSNIKQHFNGHFSLLTLQLQLLNNSCKTNDRVPPPLIATGRHSRSHPFTCSKRKLVLAGIIEGWEQDFQLHFQL